MVAARKSERAPKNRRYTVDLAAQMACCEANYARLLKLMPTFDARDHWHYDVQAGDDRWTMRLRVTERARYTTMLEITQNVSSDNSIKAWSTPPRLQVRLYHDARMAEVVAWQNHRRVRPRYDYPNRNMYHRDEKAQFNRFLEDWLSHSLAHGQSCQTVDI